MMTLREENDSLRYQLEEMRAILSQMRDEKAELEKMIRQRDHWITDLRETLDAFLRPVKAI